MTTYATQNPYELWQRSKLLGVMRARTKETFYFGQFFPDSNTFLSDEDYIDFEKLPIHSRALAPYVLPKGRGLSVYDDSARTYRFRPANVVVEESVDDDKALQPLAGIDVSMLHPELNLRDPMVRRAQLKAAMTAEAMLSIWRRWEHQRARSIIDGFLDITYLSGETYHVDFQRNANQTEILTSGNRFGDAGVSILDKFQSIGDTMNNAEFGGMFTKATMGGGVWSVLRKDPEMKAAMDAYRPYGGISLERGLTTGGVDGGKVFKVGTITVGGAGGQEIELWVNNETYGPRGQQTRYVGTNEMVFTSTPDAIMGVSAFGRIKDIDAQFQAIPIFPKNFVTGERVKVENMSFESAPLMVPINPNATYKLTPTNVAG
jgi:hypothetical protein